MMGGWPNKPVAAYIAALQDADARVRRQAAAALEILGDRQAVRPLIALLGRDADPAVRANAARALGKLGDGRAVEPLIATLGAPHPQVRVTAVGALHRLGDRRALEPLIAVLEDPDLAVCYDVGRAVGEIGDARAVRPLIAAILRRGEDDPAGRALDGAVSQLGAVAVPPLIAALTDRDRRVRAYAARALGYVMVRDRRAIAPLTLALQDEDAQVRQQAAQSLRRIEGPLSDDHLATFIALLAVGSKDARVFAAKALAASRSEQAMIALRAALEDEDPDVQRYAAESLQFMEGL